MAGCFGNSPYDRWLEQQVNDYVNNCDYDEEQIRQQEEEWEQAELEYERKRDEKLNEDLFNK